MVAKRFFCLTSDNMDNDLPQKVGVVDPDEHKEAIESEAHRLAEGHWFLKEFYSLCITKPKLHVDKSVYCSTFIPLSYQLNCNLKDIQFSPAFIGEETGLSRSVASGFPDEPGLPSKVHWLVEPKRPSTVTKFSGTLNHQTTGSDLQSLTVAAFAHFVYLKSKGQRVFADIQGMRSSSKSSMLVADDHV